MRLSLLLLFFSIASAGVVIRDPWAKGRSSRSGNELPVCIVGAGLAGLSAASELERAGVSYIVLEGASRVGGRVYPVKHGDGFLQYGATYINGDKNPIYAIAKANGLVDIDATNAADDYVPVYTEEEVIDGCDVREFAAFSESFHTKYQELSKNGHEREPFQTAFDRDYKAFIEKKDRESRRAHFDRLARMYVTDMETEWAALMNKFALANFGKHALYVEDANEFTLNKQGFSKILEVIKSGVPNRKIYFKTEIKNIDYSSKESVLLTTTNRKYRCSRAIVTVSLGYLKRHVPALFTPQLPATKKAVINALGFGNMQKLFLVYDKPWLDKSAYHSMGPSTSKIFGRGISFDVTPWSRNTVQFWFSGPAVEAIGEMSDETLIYAFTAHLTKTLKNVTVPRAKRVIRHMWYQDPLVLGSYSYLTPAAVALKDPYEKMAEPILGNNGKPLVQFAGEATIDRWYQTTVGAFLSGQREAKRVLENGLITTSDKSKISGTI